LMGHCSGTWDIAEDSSDERVYSIASLSPMARPSVSASSHACSPIRERAAAR